MILKNTDILEDGKLEIFSPLFPRNMANMRRGVYFAFFILLFFESAVQQQQPLNSSTELTALLDLRSSLGLRSSDWPRQADPCLIWNGISCRNGRVVGINISGFRRTHIGSINPRFVVDSLANLTLLQSFNASKFLLPGEIPGWFGLRLRSLQVLDLRFCSVIGAIPTTLAESTSRLYLSNNGLTGIIPASLGQLLHLSVLDLGNNSLTGSIPSALTSLHNLTLLDLSSNGLTGTIHPGIGTLSNLQSLNFSVNFLSGSLPQDFRGLRNLQRMEIGNNLIRGSLSENMFANLKQLQVIVLKNNYFNGSVPDLLWSMPELLLLDISGNNFTGNFPDSPLNSTTKSATLNISNNLFYGSLTPLFRRFDFVDLSMNYFYGKVPDYVPTNASLLQSNCLQNLMNQRTMEECSSFYEGRGLPFDYFDLTTEKTRGKSNNKLIIFVTVFGGLALIVVLALIIVLFLRSHRVGAPGRRVFDVRQALVWGDESHPGLSIDFLDLGDSFTYWQILQATNGLSDSNLIKQGHSGDLFRGRLENGTPVVVKRVDLRFIKKETYLSELNFLSKVTHRRLVPLLGHCSEKETEKFLVYKHMPNGDLSSSLFDKTDPHDDNVPSLDWIKRLKIAIGAAEVLTFLHYECSPLIAHRDVQASSILLDDNCEVRLGSLSKVCAQKQVAHRSTEQDSSGFLASVCSDDVYCFGKVLLELVTGEIGMSLAGNTEYEDFLDQKLLSISISDKDLVTKIVDPTLIVDVDLLEEVWAVAMVAKCCLNPEPSRRPLMRYVLEALEDPVKVVREESGGSPRLGAVSSRGSWNGAFFRSCSPTRQLDASFKWRGTP